MRPQAAPRSAGTDLQALHEVLSRLIRLYQFRDRDRICRHDLSVAQCYALERIVHDGPLALNALATGLYLDKSTASRVVDALERKGYATRRSDPDDRRAVQLAATALGRQLHARIERELLDELAGVISDSGPAVRRGMIRVLERLAGNAEARMYREDGQPTGGRCATRSRQHRPRR